MNHNIEFAKNLLPAIKDSSVVFYSYSKSKDKYDKILAGINKAVEEFDILLAQEDLKLNALTKKYIEVSNNFSDIMIKNKDGELIEEFAYYDTIQFVMGCISVILISKNMMPIVLPDLRALIAVSNLTGSSVKIQERKVEKKQVETSTKPISDVCDKCGRKRKPTEVEMNMCFGCTGMLAK